MKQYEKNFIENSVYSLLLNYRYQRKSLCLRAYVYHDRCPEYFSGQLVVLFDYADTSKCIVLGKYLKQYSEKSLPADWYISIWDTDKFLDKLLQDIDLDELYLEVFYNEDFFCTVKKVLKECKIESDTTDSNPYYKIIRIMEDEGLQEHYKMITKFDKRKILFRTGFLEEEDFK